MAGFTAHPEPNTGAELPRFIEDEFDAFIECDILACGFASLCRAHPCWPAHGRLQIRPPGPHLVRRCQPIRETVQFYL